MDDVEGVEGGLLWGCIVVTAPNSPHNMDAYAPSLSHACAKHTHTHRNHHPGPGCAGAGLRFGKIPALQHVSPPALSLSLPASRRPTDRHTRTHTHAHALNPQSSQHDMVHQPPAPRRLPLQVSARGARPQRRRRRRRRGGDSGHCAVRNGPEGRMHVGRREGGVVMVFDALARSLVPPPPPPHVYDRLTFRPGLSSGGSLVCPGAPLPCLLTSCINIFRAWTGTCAWAPRSCSDHPGRPPRWRRYGGWERGARPDDHITQTWPASWGCACDF